MKKFWFVFNLIIFIISSVVTLCTTLFSIVSLIIELEILMPFAISFNYVSLITSTLSFVINLITYSVRRGNKLLFVSIIVLTLSVISFALTMLA